MNDCILCHKADSKVYNLIAENTRPDEGQSAVTMPVQVAVCDEHILIVRAMPPCELSALLRHMKPGA